MDKRPAVIQHSDNPMDRPLNLSVLNSRKRKRILQIAVPGVVLIGAFLFFSAWIAPSISRNEIRTAVVDSGLVEASISATGTVIPGFEEAISSPTETRVLKVLKQPGEKVSKGDQFLLVDLSEPSLALDRAEKDLALKTNSARQFKLEQEHSINDLESQLRIKRLRLAYLKSKTAQEQRMYEIGGTSKDQLEQSKLEEEIASTEQAGLDQSIRNAEQSLKNQLESYTTEIATLKKERADIQRQLDILSCRSPREGVLTMVAQEIGSTIHRGDIIARIANLNEYRVDAEVSDIHSGTIIKGQRAHVSWTGVTLDGEVSNINPSIENGIIKFSLSLVEKSDLRLRSNLRVDVAVVTADKGVSLRVAKGPFLTGSGAQEVFVVRGDRGVRTTATIGASGYDYVEVLGGLAKGDEVIVSDMKDYLHVKEVRLK